MKHDLYYNWTDNSLPFILNRDTISVFLGCLLKKKKNPWKDGQKQRQPVPLLAGHEEEQDIHGTLSLNN